ncbi:MAG: hypothetical protein R2827_03245 [Bdellovibrionales bacterium]
MPRIVGINKQIQGSDIAAGAIPKDADAIVGSTAQVNAGLATHDDIQAAHDELVDGQKLLILENVLNLTTPTPLVIAEKLRGFSGSSIMFNNQGERRGDIFSTPDFPVNLTEIQLNVGLAGSGITGTPNVVVDLWNTSGGIPTGGVGGFIASSAGVPYASLPSPINFNAFTPFSFSPFALAPSTVYAFSTKQDVFNTGGVSMAFYTVRPVLTQGYLFDDVEGAGFQIAPNDEWTSYKILGTANGLTLSKRLRIEGLGFGSQLAGIVTFEPGSENSIISGLRFNSKLTLNTDQIHISDCWQASGQEIDDNGQDNSIRIIQEE